MLYIFLFWIALLILIAIGTWISTQLYTLHKKGYIDY
jgi:hypothetical protein